MGATSMKEVAALNCTGADSYFDATAETMPREALAALQFERLRKTLRNAHDNVALHRQRLLDADVIPEEVRTLDDLRRIPFTYKTDLRDHYPFGMFARPLTDISRLHASSGTTGKATVVGYTHADIDHWANLIRRC